jgi:hypothetical protein
VLGKLKLSGAFLLGGVIMKEEAERSSESAGKRSKGDQYSLMFCKDQSDEIKKDLGLVDLTAMSSAAIRERAGLLRSEIRECLDRNSTFSGSIGLEFDDDENEEKNENDEFEDYDKDDNPNDYIISTCEEGISEMLAECCEFVTEIQTLVHELEECQNALSG